MMSMDGEVRQPAFEDQDRRDRLRTDLGTSLFVEAGAGTGKTTALVSRIVALVAFNSLPMHRLVAITFTEAAASDLRGRIRRGLEEGAQSPDHSFAERERLEEAAALIDLAAIQTIHSFAGTLLRTYPLESGLPPAFETLDPVRANLLFDDRFRVWLYDDIPGAAPENRRRRDAIRHALLVGITFENLRDLSVAVEENLDLLDAPPWVAPDPQPALPLARAIAADLQRVFPLVAYARNGEADPLVREIRRLEPAVRRLTSVGDERDALAALVGLGKIAWNSGKQTDWDRAGAGELPIRQIKAALKTVQLSVEEAIVAHRASALSSVLRYTLDFARQGAIERRTAGVATFQDLLVSARDLLRTNKDVRHLAQCQFDCIFVDEFQDTDPLQVEIVWFLAHDPAGLAVENWSDAPPLPGKVFLVGDPKQSIYHFRRADIGLYERIRRDADPNSSLTLVQNFRSLPAVLDWVNHHFTHEMVAEPGIQAGYVHLVAAPYAGEVRGTVHSVGSKLEGNAAEIRRQEADGVARAIRLMIDERWLTRCKPEGQRDMKYGDVCILMRSRMNVRALEEALGDYGIPYRVEGGSLVLDTQEVRDLLSCLRAIDDPSDQVALVAALRSPAYSCSDEDLLAWVDGGMRLSYDPPNEDRTGPVAAALESLLAFHHCRSDRSLAATIEGFIRDRMLAIGAFGHPRPRETLRRLRYVVARARAMAAAGRPTLRAFLDWLEHLQRAEFRDLESPIPDADDDAVRLITIHGAKGLEFPVVFLTGLGAVPRSGGRGVQVIPDRDHGRLEVGFGGFQTPGFAAARDREKQHDVAEHVRLLYVAATRARDHLVLGVNHAKATTPAARILELLGNADPSVCRSLNVDHVEKPPPTRPITDAREAIDPIAHQTAEDSWIATREALVERLAEEVATTPTELVLKARGIGATRVARRHSGSVGHYGSDELLFEDDGTSSDLDDPESAPVPTVADRAIRIGRAVHAALVAAGGDPGEGRRAAAIASRLHGVRDELAAVEALVHAVLTSSAYRSALTATRYWHEVPVGVEVASVLLEGRIDLLWERSDGTLGILDVKTDRIAPSDAAARAGEYRLQLGAYALAVQEVTRKRVGVIQIIFAGLGGQVVTFEDVGVLVGETRGLIAGGDRG